MKIIKYILLIFLFFSCCKNENLSESYLSNNLTQIDSLFEILTYPNLSDSDRNHLFDKSKIAIDKLEYDSLKINSLLKLVYKKLLIRSFENYVQINNELLEFYERIPEDSNKALALEYFGYYYRLKNIPDSSFYFYNSAFKVYSNLDNELQKGNMLINMATIQESVNDYTGSEINSVKAISSLKNSKDYRSQYLVYNNLGVVYNKLNRFDLAIENFEKSIAFSNKLRKESDLEALSLNNIGRIYSKKGDYLKSLEFYNSAIRIKDLFILNPEIYAMVINNIAYSKFKLGDEAELPELFYESLKIRDSLQIFDGIVTSSLNLSEYFLAKNDSVKAFDYGQNAEKNAIKSNYNEGILESYLQLSRLEPGKNGKTYLNKYIKLSDSLQQNEREIREKFTRVAYETGEIEKENVVVTKRNGLLTILILVGVALFTMIFIYIRQRSKNKELIFSQKQEEANTEIYNLMISEKTKFNEGSLKERVRISEELHDGIVNKLFGTRLSLSLMNSGIPEEEIVQWDGYIESLREIEEDIRTLSHELKVEVFNIDNTFEKMVEELVEKRSKLSNFEPNLDFDIVSDWENISNKIKIHCYRTLQETLHNIHKYAKATKVRIHFSEINGMLHVEIMDNGIGFNPNNKTKGIGLKNIVSRIEKLNGEVKFISSPENGTKISMIIPLVS